MVCLTVPQVSSGLPTGVVRKAGGGGEAWDTGQVAGLQVGRGLLFAKQQGAH